MLTITLNSWPSLMSSRCLAQFPKRNSIPFQGENESKGVQWSCQRVQDNGAKCQISLAHHPPPTLSKNYQTAPVVESNFADFWDHLWSYMNLLEMLIEDEINSKGRHFLRKLGHRWLRIRIVKNANPSHLISLSPDKKLALNLNLVPLLSAGDGPFVFFWKHEFLASLKHFYSHFSLVRYASYRDWMKAFNLILINTDAPHFRRGWSWTLAARMAFSRRSKKKADNGSIGGETRWRPRLLSSSVVKIFFCFTMCLMLEKMGRMSRDDHLLIAKVCRLSRQKTMWRKNGFNVNAGITQISPIYHLLV